MLPEVATEIARRAATPFSTITLPALTVRGEVAAASEAPAPRFPLLPLAAGLALGVTLVGTVVHAARGIAALAALRHAQRTLPRDANAQSLTDTLRARLGISRPVTAVQAATPTPPFIFGHRHPRVALPPHLDADSERLHLALTHELIHVRRAYGNLLLSFASAPSPALTLSATPGLPDLTRRLRTLASTTMPPDHLHRLTRLTRGASVTLTLVLASSLAVTVAAQDRPAPPPPDTLDQYPEVIGGMEALREAVRYPQSARDDQVQGRVLVTFVVTQQGDPTQVQINTSPDTRLSQAAREAVSRLRFRPAASNGEPVRAQMTFPIQFSLGDIESRDAPGVEAHPELIGGMEALRQRLTYPADVKADGVEGTVLLQFTVDTEGDVREIEALRSPDARLTDAAIEALRDAEFHPGRRRGRKVSMRYTLPVRFMLPADEKETQG